ncbi:hypothetical protein D931_00463 [Enterococcus faecium 13.SD.W.09]|nr:hypothetical protein D931_00463 [Enterococcus faecium 13.SD.W.09]
MFFLLASTGFFLVASIRTSERSENTSKKACKICLLLLSNHTEKQPEVNAQQKKQRKNSFLLFLQRKSCLFSKFSGFLW